MKKLLNTPGLKHILLGVVVCMLVFGPLQPLVAHAMDDGGTGCSVGIGVCLSSIIYVFTVGIGSGFAYVAAMFFNIAINLSLNGPIYALTFVSTGWTTARDLANMAFLFILIYIAYTIMLEADTSGTMSLLAGVIVVALLVNFSFFFTRIVIDAGNIVSIQFYNSITAPSVASTAQTGGIASTGAKLTGGGANTKDLTASIMGMLNLQSFLGTKSFATYNASAQSAAGGLGQFITLSFLYLTAGVMFWLLTVTFITAGIKFLVRIVILWFLIIASPLAFVARATPQFRKYFDQWREMLVAHAFYPVAFMFIFLMLVNFANQMSPSGGSNSLLDSLFASLTNANNTSSGVGGVAMAIVQTAVSMGFVIIVLYIGLKASDRISVAGGKFAEGAGKWVGGAYKNTMSWGAGAAYRNTGGRAANFVDTKLKNSEWANKTGTLGGIVGYRLRKNVLAPMKETSLGTVAPSFKERKEFLDKRESDMAANVRDRENKQKVKDTAALVATNIAAGKSAADGINIDDKNRIQNLNKRELEVMKADDITAIAPLLKEGQIKLIEGMEKLTDTQKETIKKAWQGEAGRAIEKKIGGAKADIASGNPVSDINKKKVQDLTKKELEGMETAQLKNLALVLSEDQKKKLEDLESISSEDREEIKNIWEEKASDAPLQKSLRKLAEIKAASPAAAAAIATHKATPGAIVDTAWVNNTLKAILDTEHSAATAAWNQPDGRNFTNHAVMQKAKDALDSFKEFDKNRKDVQPNDTINNNGAKGTYKSNLIP